MRRESDCMLPSKCKRASVGVSTLNRLKIKHLKDCHASNATARRPCDVVRCRRDGTLPRRCLDVVELAPGSLERSGTRRATSSRSATLKVLVVAREIDWPRSEKSHRLPQGANAARWRCTQQSLDYIASRPTCLHGTAVAQYENHGGPTTRQEIHVHRIGEWDAASVSRHRRATGRRGRVDWHQPSAGRNRRNAGGGPRPARSC